MRRNLQSSQRRQNVSLLSRPPFYPVSVTRETVGIYHNRGKVSPSGKRRTYSATRLTVAAQQTFFTS